MTDDNVDFVKCAGCGEYVPVDPYLLAGVPASEITDYLCGVCEELRYGSIEDYEASQPHNMSDEDYRDYLADHGAI